MKCSLGVCAYNEEKNIGQLLTSVLDQELRLVEIAEIFVVASGCTDKTVAVAQDFARKDSRIKVLIQEQREGKYSAVNLFLKNASSEILVLAGADLILERQAIEKLLESFSDVRVGMTGGRPVSREDPKTFLGFASYLLWDLHHQISLQAPKMGEMVAFRNAVSVLPPTAVDEAYFEAWMKKNGYQIVYVPEAIVYNYGPKTVADFIKQRRRIACGHLILEEKTGYSVSTANSLGVAKLILKNLKPGLKPKVFTLGVVFLEIISRWLGVWDYKVGKKQYLVWTMVER